MTVITATAGPHEEGARRALLRRRADDLAALAGAAAMAYTCCWLD